MGYAGANEGWSGEVREAEHYGDQGWARVIASERRIQVQYVIGYYMWWV